MSNPIQIVCPKCSALNKAIPEKMAQKPTCGKCKSLLFEGHPAELTSNNFMTHINKNHLPVIVDFWAPWCAPCKMMAPQFEAAAKELEPYFRLAKLNTEEHQNIASKFKIQGIPTMIIFIKGKEKARTSGAMNSPDIIRWIKNTV